MKFVLAAPVLYCGVAFAAWSQVPILDLKIDAPPPRDSAVAKGELLESLRIVKSRSDQDCRFAKFAADKPVKELFLRSGKISPAEMERALSLINQATQKSIEILKPLKKKYARPRPYSVNSDITVCPGIQKSQLADSYPSGHGVVAYTAGCVLELIYPERAGELKDWTERLVRQRVVAGMHFSSDIAASKKIALAVCGRAAKEKDFAAQAEAARVIDPRVTHSEPNQKY